nr:MAG TPA: hypothetical protein [Caudoviricetes sp.]
MYLLVIITYLFLLVFGSKITSFPIKKNIFKYFYHFTFQNTIVLTDLNKKRRELFLTFFYHRFFCWFKKPSYLCTRNK